MLVDGNNDKNVLYCFFILQNRQLYDKVVRLFKYHLLVDGS